MGKTVGNKAAFLWNKFPKFVLGFLAVSAIAYASMTLSTEAIRFLRKGLTPDDDDDVAVDLSPLTVVPVALSRKDLHRRHEMKKVRRSCRRCRWLECLQPWNALPVALGLAWVAIGIIAFLKPSR